MAHNANLIRKPYSDGTSSLNYHLIFEGSYTELEGDLRLEAEASKRKEDLSDVAESALGKLTRTTDVAFHGLIRQVIVSLVTPANSGTVRKLNSVLFPVRYSEQFYKDIVAPTAENFCKLVYFNDVPVGTICCRLEKSDHEGEGKLYLMTMGILAPYRSRKLGSKALQEILTAANSHSKPKITSVRLHVQENNEDARRFYERHGFEVVGLEPEYYKRIEPHGAWVLERAI